ncbi:MAG: hypothetical protein ACLQVI_19960 [Polyangiaceae bacterium]|jgi:hypothetical protein
MERAGRLMVFLFAIAGQAGCASTSPLEPGLANVPAVPLGGPFDVHDVIANGRDSCPGARVASGDPLRYRYPACPGGETTPVNVTLLAVPVPPPGPEDDLWNLHLRGLPPCEGDLAERAGAEIALAVCRPN